MTNNVLITGGSGYLGGTLLNQLKDANLPSHNLYALVRTRDQAEAVKQYGAEPLTFEISDESSIREHVLKHQINIVFFLVDAVKSTSQEYFIQALGELKKSGMDVHFLHTTGAKMFSSHTGAPEGTLIDNDPRLHTIQQDQKSSLPMFQQALDTNNTIIEEGEKHGVRTYIFIPCMVYGKGEGFGNPVSIQTVAVLKAAHAAGRVCRFDHGTSWPVSHVLDTATLYIALLRRILEGEYPDCGSKGYYLAASGNVAWEDVYSKIAEELYKRGTISDSAVHDIDDNAWEKIAATLKCSKDMVPPQLSGQCSLVARHGLELGWKPQYTADHMLESLGEEVALILESQKS